MTETTVENVDRVRALLRHLNERDVEAALADVDESVVYDAPGYDLHVTGRAELARMFDAVLDRFSEVRYEITAHHETVDRDLVIVEARGDNAVRGSDKRYRNQYVHLVRFRDGRLVHWTEHSSPRVYAEAVEGAA